MANSNQNLIGASLDSRPTYIDSIELRVRGQLNHETYIRATPDSAMQILTMPSSSDWDWHPAQIRFLTRDSLIPRPPNSVVSSYENQDIERLIPEPATRKVDNIELRVRDQSGYEMYIRAATNTALSNLDMPPSSDWDWHAAQVHFLNKKPQVPSQPTPAALAERTCTPSASVASVVAPEANHDSRYNRGSFMVPAGANGHKLSLHEISLNYLSMELKLRGSFSVEPPSTEDSARTSAKRFETNVGSLLIFEDSARKSTQESFKTNVEPLLLFENVLDVMDGRWGRELYELQLENTIGGDSITLDSIPESFAFVSSNDDTIKTIFRLKPCYLEMDTQISVRFKYHTSELIFSMVAALKFRIIFNVACELWQVSYEKMRFLLNGCRVIGDETPESIEMEDGDIIEAYLELAGGGPTKKGKQEDDRSAGYIVPSIEGTSNAIIPDVQEATAERLSESYLDIKPNFSKGNNETATDDFILFSPPASRDELPGTPASAEGKQPQSKRGITIKVKDDTENEIFLNVMHHTKFSVVMKACEKQWDKINLRFFSPDGRRILPDDTPDTLGLEDGDQISALIHTWGGC